MKIAHKTLLNGGEAKCKWRLTHSLTEPSAGEVLCEQTTFSSFLANSLSRATQRVYARLITVYVYLHSFTTVALHGKKDYI